MQALAEQHDVRCGRVLLDALMDVTAKKGGTGELQAKDGSLALACVFHCRAAHDMHLYCTC
eukprot:1159880-Pelagomonas_calceolata.AAC.11